VNVTAEYFEAPVEVTTPFSPQDLVAACFERGVWNVLFDEGSLSPEFFDLSSGLAGEIVQKLVNYGIRAGIVIPDVATHSDSFRSFVRESNRTGQARFFTDRADAISWLIGT